MGALQGAQLNFYGESLGALQGAPFNFYSGPFGSTMAGSSADLPLPQPPITHGDGSDRGYGSDSDAVPSGAPSLASCMPGDLDDVEENTDFWMKPEWGDGASDCCSAGV